jgi:hypothetical protein
MIGYEGVERESLVVLEIALSKALKVEKGEQGKKDIKYELKRIRKALGKEDICL